MRSNNPPALIQPDRVHVLSAGTRGTENIHFDIARVNINLRFVHGGGRGERPAVAGLGVREPPARIVRNPEAVEDLGRRRGTAVAATGVTA